MKCGEGCDKEAVWKKHMPDFDCYFLFCDEHKDRAIGYGRKIDKVIRIKKSKSSVHENIIVKGIVSEEEFLKVYKELPDDTKKSTIFTIGIYGPCSWSVVRNEVVAGTKVGKQMLIELSKLKNWRFKK